MVMVCADPHPLSENNVFLYRERKLGVSGRGCGYMDFGLVFWEPLGKMTENPQKAPKVAGILDSRAILCRWGVLDV
jgi:hypothetical protein